MKAMIVVTAAAALAACQSPTGGEGRRVVGIIEVGTAAASVSAAASMAPAGDSYAPSAPLMLPDTVAAGAAFTATITTTGPNGCWRASDVVKVAGEAQVTLTPYDLAPAPGAVCPDAPVTLPRTVELRFDQPGVARVRLEGRRVTAGASGEGVATAVERTVVVR